MVPVVASIVPWLTIEVPLKPVSGPKESDGPETVTPAPIVIDPLLIRPTNPGRFDVTVEIVEIVPEPLTVAAESMNPSKAEVEVVALPRLTAPSTVRPFVTRAVVLDATVNVEPLAIVTLSSSGEVPDAVRVVPPTSVADLSVAPPPSVKLALTDTFPATVRKPPVIARVSVEVMLFTVTVPVLNVIVGLFVPRSITTSSPAVGTRPRSQFPGTFQLPLTLLIQLIVAGRTLSSIDSNARRRREAGPAGRLERTRRRRGRFVSEPEGGSQGFAMEGGLL
ncbi:MAG: hypothetical protein AB7I30_03850 [Isosphaeraceae bacterium]